MKRIKDSFLGLEGFFVPCILILSLLIAWTGEYYFDQTPIHAVEYEEGQKPAKSGFENEFDFKKEKEEKLDTLDLKSCFLNRIQKDVKTLFYLNTFRTYSTHQITNYIKLYILYCSILLDY